MQTSIKHNIYNDQLQAMSWPSDFTARGKEHNDPGDMYWYFRKYDICL